MNLLHTADFIRSVTRRITEGSGPSQKRLDEWAIYQADLEMNQQMKCEAKATRSQKTSTRFAR
jgi:hypothetical protein